MVDSIGSGGQTPKVSQTSAVQKPADKKEGQVEKTVRADEIALSEEALSLSNAQQTAEQTSAQLAENDQITLSSDEDRLNSLV